ncbi:STAS domain-containing protein [Streptomyces sediminimaris]|uniref:STAS domain-containing protein n=1 Tax=Streptomyces sediminimaris TaxID=3383721 RepID=UPI00399AC309
MEAQPLRLTPRWADAELLVVEAEGVFDAASAPLLCGPLVKLLGVGHRQFVVDAKRVTHFNAVGIRLLAKTLRRVRAEGGTLALVAGPDARDALETAGFGGSSVLYATVGEASRACKAPHRN